MILIQVLSIGIEQFIQISLDLNRNVIIRTKILTKEFVKLNYPITWDRIQKNSNEFYRFIMLYSDETTTVYTNIFL